MSARKPDGRGPLWDIAGPELTAYFEGVAKHFGVETAFERAGKCTHCFERFCRRIKAAVDREEDERRKKIN